MKRSALLATLMLMAIVPAARGQSFGTAEDEAAIRAVIARATEAFSTQDARAAASVYGPSARLVTVRGDVWDGQKAIEAGLAAIFAARAQKASMRTLDTAIRFIRPDIALVHVANELSGLVMPDGQGLPPHQELSLRVFVKESGAWRIEAFHNTIVRPFGTPAR
jgi:uncharacterized protein (TIGR02246 family)